MDRSVSLAEVSVNLKRQALGGAAWSLARFGSEQVFRFFVFAFLARVLSPKDFGIFALASIFVDVGRVLSSAGLAETMIRAEKADDELADTMFWWALTLASGAAILLGVLSVPMANLLNQPAVAPVILALSVCLMFGPMTVVHSARATRDFRNKELTGIALVANFSSGATAVVCALNGMGIWSFVISQVVYGAISTVLIWVYFPWMPTWKGFSKRRLSQVAGFSGNMVLAQLLYTAIARAQDFITGQFLGPAMLGQIRVAGRVFEVINMALISPLAAVALPTLSRLQDDNQRFRNAYARMLALSCLVACPASFGFAAVARDALPLLFGSQWTEAIPLVQILGLSAPAAVLGAFAGPTLTALGRADTVVRFALLQLVTVAIASLWAVQYGIIALAAIGILRVYLILPVQLWLFKKATGMTAWEILRNMAPSTLAAGGMALTVGLWLEPMVRGMVDNSILRLCITVPAGAVIYFGILFLIWRKFMFEQIAGVRSALRPNAA